MSITIATVRATLESRMESDEPDEVLALLETQDGKPLTKRILEKLPGGAERWRLSRRSGMTHLETLDYVRSGGNTGIHLLMAYAEKSVTIDATWVEEHNPAYFKGRRERNASRRVALKSQELLADMVNALNEVAMAKSRFDAAKGNLDGLTSGDFSPDHYEWERLCGAREERS